MIRVKTQLSFILLIWALLLNAQVTESVLSDGEWYKLSIPHSGIYKIDAAFISSQNITIQPGSKIHIYGQKGGMLPENISIPRTNDLVRFPICEVNVNEGPLAPNSAIYFYSEGGDVWKSENSDIFFQKNVYDQNNYVFLKIAPEPTSLILSAGLSDKAEFTFNTYSNRQRYEEDKANPLGVFPTTHGSGQEWYGDEFSNLREKDYSSKFDFENVFDATDVVDVDITAEFVGRSNVPTTFELIVNDQVFTKNIGSVRTGDVEAIHARKGKIEAKANIRENNGSITVLYPPVNAESKGWLDYIEIKNTQGLEAKDSPYFFYTDLHFSSGTPTTAEFQNSVRPTTRVWDITNPEMPLDMTLNDDGWTYSSDEVKKFYVFDLEHVPTPDDALTILPNQNVHGILDADMIIIYSKNWKSAAERLSAHRSDYSELLVETIDVEQIYNEFSSGRQDPSAIRDFAKMLKDRSENFKYLLLFGDGSYDFRGLDAATQYQSFVPTYETKESLDPLDAFPSDDYFAQLDDNEGIGLRGDLDIAVGRLPARTLAEANNFVDKLIAYDLNKSSFGDWRSRIAFLADDEDSNLHLNDADVIASKVSAEHPLFNQKKIYWDAFQQESTPGGNRYPSANNQLNTEIEDGLLVVNYLGHGGPKGWSQERVLNLDDITSWSNLEKLPLVITATCSFTGFDDPSLTTAGEATIHNPSGGAIALFTTVRSVYASQNFRLTSAVFDTIFTKVNGEYMTIGEVMQSAKNTRVNDVVNARKFFLIGDPSMKLAIPRQNIETTIFDGKDVDGRLDTIGALKKVLGKSQILRSDGTIDASFNGEADITLFDKESNVKTLRNDPGSFEKSFKVQKNILYSGKVSVINGEMDFEFIIPLDINYDYGPGRLSYYAVSDEGSDAAGFFEDFIIGGTSQDAVIDEEGPSIDIFLNSKSFISGDQITLTNPVVIADFFDESGINVSNVSIGHEIVSIVDDDTKTTEVLNQKYKGDKDDFRNGNLTYRLENLIPGLHSLTIRAFDVLNNPGSSTIEFEVAENFDGFLESVFAYPNPFHEKTFFNIENELGETVDVTLNIYNVNGQLIHTIVKSGITNEGLIQNVEWDGRGSYGPISGGIYMYEVEVKGINNEKSLKSGLKKIIMLK